MWRKQWILWAAVLAVSVAGCGGSGDNPQKTGSGEGDQPSAARQAGVQTNGPAAAVAEFLEAVRTGNDAVAMNLLSETAREKTLAQGKRVTPKASDTARFEIGQVSMVGEDGARVACIWTDLDGYGQTKTDDATWMVRRESPGWRIVGVAYTIFPGEPPLLLNFEDPDDMARKQRWVQDEFARREAEARTTRPDVPGDPIRR